jgi:pre-mRNA-splicing helicase BRR2
MTQPLQIVPINKAHGLLVLHFSRIPLPPDLVEDCKKVLTIGVRLLHALVDIISSFGYLKSLILTMQLCQMLVQAMWINDSPLLQVMDK